MYITKKILESKQRKRMQEARKRGIRKGLIELRQYDALEMLESGSAKEKPAEEYIINQGSSIKREDNNNKSS